MHQISIWEQETFFRQRDIVIIGAGFTGLWTALHLKKKYPHKAILIVESGIVPTGASGRNAGFACFGSPSEIVSDIETMGLSNALELVAKRYKGLQMIQQYFNATDIDFDLCGGYELLQDEKYLNELDRLNEWIAPITGVKQTYQISQDKLNMFGFAKAKYLVENQLEGGLHSGKLLVQLTNKVQQLGVEFLFATSITHTEESATGVRLTTQQGFNVSAEKIVICTNAYAKKLLPEIDIVPARGQVLVTAPIPNLKIKGTFHYEEGYYYFRNFGDRLLLGGARNKDVDNEKTTVLATTELIQNELERFLNQVILPGKQPAITHRWAGVMAMGSEKTPIVNNISDRISCIVRLGGMGVALAPVISKELVQIL